MSEVAIRSPKLVTVTLQSSFLSWLHWDTMEWDYRSSTNFANRVLATELTKKNIVVTDME